METGKTNNKINNIIDKLQFGGELVDDYTKIAEIFNQHFTSVAKVNVVSTNYKTSSANNRYTPAPIYYILQSFNRMFSNFKLMPLSTKDIRNIIKPLTTKNSHGYDEVSTKLLKNSVLPLFSAH